MLETDDTIVAISSAAGVGARGIVRVSGDRAIAVCSRMVTPTDGRPLAELAGFELADGWIDSGDGPRIPGRVLVFRAPASYTRQDVVELHLPACAPLMQAVVGRLIGAGARAAEAGEFTARAFLLGRIDLTQAEAVAAVIHANAATGLRAAQHLLAGELSDELAALHDALCELAALVELGIDFSDQDIELIPPAGLRERLARLARRVEALLSRSGRFEQLDRVPRVAVVGRANVGKSSLVNALAGRRRSIVAEHPGTTRDVLRELVVVETGKEMGTVPFSAKEMGTVPISAAAPHESGWPDARGNRDSPHFQRATLMLEDRAGLGDSADPLAPHADASARRELAQVDAILFVFDAAAGWTDVDAALFTELPDVPVVVVGNKIDLAAECEENRDWHPISPGTAADEHPGAERNRCLSHFPSIATGPSGEKGTGPSSVSHVPSTATGPSGEMEEMGTVPFSAGAMGESPAPDARGKGDSPLPVSALRGTGLDALRERLAEIVLRTVDRSESGLMLTARHRGGLRSAAEAIERAAQLASDPPPAELIAAELAEATDALALLLGRRYSEGVLSQIFSRFCIGK